MRLPFPAILTADDPSRRRMLFGIAAVPVAFLAGGGLGYGLGGVQPMPGSASHAMTRVETIALPDIVTNLDSPAGAPVFVRLRAAVEVPKGRGAGQIATVEARIRDSLTTHLRALRPEDLQGPRAAARLRSEILNRVARAAAPVEVSGALIVELLVQ